MGMAYWQRSGRHRTSRRRFLGGALAAGAGAAGLALTGCGGGQEEAAPPVPAPTGAALEKVRTRGGVYRVFGSQAGPPDTRDPHQTRFGPISEVNSAVFSRVLRYEDDYEQVLAPDLSAAPDGGPGMPEEPDEETYIIRVRPTARFHDTPEIRKNFPQVAGRPLVAEDVKYSIERQINPDSPQSYLYHRRDRWENVDKIELIDDLTLKITTKGPVASFLHFLGDSWDAVIPREVVDENDEMNDDHRLVGSGPWIFKEFKPLDAVRYVRNPEWFAADDLPDLGMGRPFLDALEFQWSPFSDSVQETAFRTKQIDAVALTDDANLWRIAGEIPQAFMIEAPQTGGLATALLINRPPYDDFRVRKAIGIAQDRQILGEQAYPSPAEHPRFMFSAVIQWPVKRWVLPYEEVTQAPGYRFGPGEREEDLAEARRLWEAAGGSEAIGPVEIMFAGSPPFIQEKMLPQVKRQIEENLVVRVETDVDSTGYTRIISCVVRNLADPPGGSCSFLWTFDDGWLDPHDSLYAYFHTDGRKNYFRLSDPQMDALLEEQARELNYERRLELCFQIQRMLINDIIPSYRYFNAIVRTLCWSYVKNTYPWSWWGRAYWYANMWLDHENPEFSGRPA